MEAAWPSALWLVRHGESLGNVAAVEARQRGLEVIDIEPRDADVDLSERGERQAVALGRWLAGRPVEARPEVARVSPYRRARRTAEIAVAGLDGGIPVGFDERLRDRELGILDRLTDRGIEARQPVEAASRRRLGKFYHRPAGGESWADVLLRLRAAWAELRTECAGRRVLVVTHDVVVVLFRYIIEDLDETEALAISRHSAPLNCGITQYEMERGGLVIRHYNRSIDPEGRMRAPDV